MAPNPLRLGPHHLPEFTGLLVGFAYGLFFLSAAWMLAPEQAFLGLLHPDQLVYFACGRELFENGNGLFYAQPYSNLAESPRLYSHLGFLIYGYLWKLTGESVLLTEYLLRLVFGPAMLVLAVRVFRAASGRRPLPVWGGLFLVAAGGLAWFTALLHTLEFRLMDGRPMSLDLWVYHFVINFRQAESGYGYWYLNLVGNLGLTNELIYHTLVFSGLLFLLRGRLGLGCLFAALAWWAHPFTGVFMGGLVAAWLAVEAIMRRPRAGRWFAFMVVLNLIFLYYNLVWLKRFPEHALVAQQMEKTSAASHPMLFGKVLNAYGLVLVGALAALASPRLWRRARIDPRMRLMLTWLVVSAGLVFHDRIVGGERAIQPMHFTRGYLFMPLLFLTIHAMSRLRARWRVHPRAYALLAAALLLLHLPDPYLHAGLHRAKLVRTGSQFIIEAPVERLMEALDRLEPHMTLHGHDLPGGYEMVNRLIPTLTHHRALRGHRFNTPDYNGKGQAAGEFMRTLDPAVAERLRLDILITRHEHLDRLRRIQPGLLEAVLWRDPQIVVIRLAR